MILQIHILLRVIFSHFSIIKIRMYILIYDPYILHDDITTHQAYFLIFVYSPTILPIVITA